MQTEGGTDGTKPIGAEALGRWLDGQALALERRPDRLLAAARERFRSQHLEPPSPECLERLVRSVLDSIRKCGVLAPMGAISVKLGG